MNHSSDDARQGRRVVLGALVAVPAMSLLGCGGGEGPGPKNGGDSPSDSASAAGGPTDPKPAAKGSAPEFSLPSLDGGIVSLSDHLGKKVILVDFWSTTCHPCLEEMPHLVELYEKLKDKGFIVLGVAGDGPDTRRDVTKVVREKGVTFPILLDEETSVVARYNPKKEMPFWALIDKSGNIVKKKNGYNPGDEKTLAVEIEKLLQ